MEMAICSSIDSKSESEVAQWCPTLWDPTDCSLPGSSIHGIFPGKNTGVSYHFFFQEIIPTQGLNPGSPALRTDALPSEPSVQFSHSVLSDSLWPRESQHARPPCPSPTLGDCSNSCPSSWWCHLILCHPLLLMPSIFPSIRVFSNESALHIRWPRYWCFSFSFSPSNEHPRLISFRMDCVDLLAVQGTLKSLLQHHSSKSSILQCSAFIMVQLSHSYMTTGETIALTRWPFVDKVMSLLFNMLSRLIITFLPRSKHLLILWLQPTSSVTLKPKKIKSLTVSIVFPSICHEVIGLDAMILVLLMLSFNPAFSLSSFTLIMRPFRSLLSAISVVSSAYLRLLIFLPEILIPACASSSPAFLMMYSAYKLDKQGDNM